LIESVVIESVEGDYPFKVFRGRLLWRGLEVRFEGVVYQSVGGPNVRASVEDTEKLRQQGVTEEEITRLEMELQQKILNGEVYIV